MKTTVVVNGKRKFVCNPADQDDLHRFLAVAYGHMAPSTEIRLEKPNDEESQKFISALIQHVSEGGNCDALFAVEV